MQESKSFLETITESSKPESFGQEKFEYVKDGKKKRKIISGVLIIIILLAGAYAITYVTGKVTVPNFVGKTTDEATIWAQKNNIILYSKNIYSFEDAENTILSQETPAGKTIRKGSTLSLKVSIGADPEEVIPFPDIMSLSTSEIEKWVSDNKLTGVKIVTVNSDIVEKDHVISYTFTDGSEDDFKRKNRVTINVSIGTAALSETVIVTDFTSMKVNQVLQWGSDNGVIINLVEDFNEYVSAGSVISQSIKNNTEIKRTDSITVVISKGKPVTVPNFESMSKDEANSWAKTNNVVLTILDRYTVAENAGSFYSQSIASGKNIKEGDEIKAFYSLGRVEVENFIGKTKLDMLNWQNDVNGKDARINLTFTETYGDKGTAGKIIGQSIKNDFINIGSTINIVISKGMKIATPDFNGKTESECTSLAKDMGLNIIFDYEQCDVVAKGYAISQSPAKNIVITDDETVTVVISLADLAADKVLVPDFSAMKAGSIMQWGLNNGVAVSLKEAYSDYIASGNVISQSVAKNSVVNKIENIVVTISKGEAPASINVPDFGLMTKDEANAWAKSNNVALVILDKYSTHSIGVLYYQSIDEDASINPGDIVTLYCSLGKVEVANYVGKTKLDILSWQKTVNGKDANIKISFIEDDSVETGTPGIILSQSIVNDLVNPGTTIRVEVSAK